jgi:hypothetical protein
VVDVSTNFVGKMDLSLNKLEKLFWPKSVSVDSESITHYVFKPAPASIKTNQVVDWARLQLKTLSPFPEGDSYHFISPKGLHAWFAASALQGIPETAMQNSFPDGNHLVNGGRYKYKQRWQDGVLVECIPTNNASLDSTDIVFSRAWAAESKLKEAVKKPSTLLSIAFALFLLSIVYLSVALVTVKYQSNSFIRNTELLQQELGEKLNTVTLLRQHQTALQGLNTWNTQDGSLPQIVALAIDSVLEQTNWSAQSIIWQNKTATIELSAPGIDIATLVGALEQQSVIADVEIRPAQEAGKWILEVSAK